MKIWTIEEEGQRLAARFEEITNRAEFARRHAIKGGASMIYQHITGRRPMSLEAAASYANAFNCKLEDISPRLANEVKSAINQSPKTHVDIDTVFISQFNTGGAMGYGLELPEQPGVIRNLQVSPEWIQKNVHNYTSISNLCVVTGFGDSMRPMFNPGDPLIVDIGIKSAKYDAVYFFRVGTEGFIKRLQRIPTSNGLILRAKSENHQKYDDWEITQDMDFEVFGRVVKVWRSEDL